jgi:hypothetical protein
MLIFTEKKMDSALLTLSEFEKECCNTLIKTESLSLLTMPKELFSQIIERSGLDKEKLQKYYRLRSENFRRLIRTNSFTEIIKLPEPQDLFSGQVKIALSGMMAGGSISYTPREYLLHLQNIVDHLKTCENHHVCLVRGPVEDRYSVYVKEERGVIIAKTSLPPVMLAINESNMTASFWDHLKTMADERILDNQDNRKSIHKLIEYIERLKKLLSSQ